MRFFLYALMTAWTSTRLYTNFTMTKKNTFLDRSGTTMYFLYLEFSFSKHKELFAKILPIVGTPERLRRIVGKISEDRDGIKKDDEYEKK